MARRSCGRSRSGRGRSRSRGARGRRPSPSHGSFPWRADQQPRKIGRSNSRRRDNRNGRQTDRSDSRKRPFGGGNEGGHQRDRSDSRKPAFKGDNKGGRQRDRSDSRKPAFKGDNKGGRQKDRSDSRKRSFGGSNDGGRQRDRSDSRKPAFDRGTARSGGGRSLHDPNQVPLGIGRSGGGRGLDAQQNSRVEEDVIDFPPSMVGRIIGKGGETIKRLQSESGAKMDINKDQNNIRISGDSYSVSLARDLVNQVIESHRDDRPRGNDDSYNAKRPSVLEEIMDIPADQMGRVIGKGGETIKRLQSESGAKMDLNKDQMNLRISGDADSIALARDLVLQVMENNRDDRRPRGNDDDSYNARRSAVLEEIIDIPPDQMGRIIGKGGETIKRLQSESGAKMDLNKDQNNLRISGDVNSIALARDLVLQVMESHRDDRRSRGDDDRRSSVLEEIMDIPQNQMGRIIGKGGEMITKLQKDSGARLDIQKDRPGIVRISGTSDTISCARHMIQSLLDEAQDKGKGGKGGKGGKSDEIMNVPPQAVGKIIGKGGEKIMQLQQESGCKINIRKDEEPGIVHLAGTSDAIAYARQLITDLLNDDGSGGGGDAMEIAQHLVQRLMSGDDLKRIEGETGVRIQMRTEEYPCKANFNGPPKGVGSAKSMLLDVMERLEFESAPQSNAGWGPPQPSSWPSGSDDFPPRPPPSMPNPMLGQGSMVQEWPPHLASPAAREQMINTMQWPDGTTYAQKEERLLMLAQHMMMKGKGGKGFGKRPGRSSSSSSSSASPVRAKQRPKPTSTSDFKPSSVAGAPAWQNSAQWGSASELSWAPPPSINDLDMDEL